VVSAGCAMFYPGHTLIIFILFLFVLTYNFILCKYTILTQTDPLEAVTAFFIYNCNYT
jgi:hypothetical protein